MERRNVYQSFTACLVTLGNTPAKNSVWEGLLFAVLIPQRVTNKIAIDFLLNEMLIDFNKFHSVTLKWVLCNCHLQIFYHTKD